MHDTEDQIDYKKILNFLNISEDIASVKLKNPTFYKEICLQNTEVKNSNIEGLGIFAINNIEKGDVIEHAIIDNYTTQAGRFINHSVNRNSYVIANGNFYLIAARYIDIGEEITIDYRQVFKICQNLTIGN